MDRKVVTKVAWSFLRSRNANTAPRTINFNRSLSKCSTRSAISKMRTIRRSLSAHKSSIWSRMRCFQCQRSIKGQFMAFTSHFYFLDYFMKWFLVQCIKYPLPCCCGQVRYDTFWVARQDFLKYSYFLIFFFF